MAELRVIGNRSIGGTVEIGGFKHVFVPVVAASVLADGPVAIDNTPRIDDAQVLAEILTRMGASVRWSGSIFDVDARALRNEPVPDELSGRIHGSLYLLPTLLGRFGRVELGRTGGCAIGSPDVKGARPTAHMVSVLERFGARFLDTRETLTAELPSGRYRASRIDICDYSGDLASGATKTAILAAATADGVSEVRNPYRKPDVTELVRFLDDAGVPVLDEGTRIVVEGRRALRSTRFRLVSDAIEMMTFITCAVHSRAAIGLTNVTPRAREGLIPECELLERMGVEVVWGTDTIAVSAPAGISGNIDLEITRDSIFSDNQPFFTLLLTAATRPSRLKDTIWPHRFDYAKELVKLGARLGIEAGSVRIEPGRPHRSGQHVVARDLRAAAVLLLAALAVPGETWISGVEHLQRGYQDLVGKLVKLGAHIERLPERSEGAHSRTSFTTPHV